jgi:hypothetical protein
MKVYVVATLIHPPTGQGDVFLGDVILITGDESKARIYKHQVLERRPIPGLDYGHLIAFNDVIYFERELEQIVQNARSGIPGLDKKPITTEGV